VGAAVRTPGGKIFSGANVENASYGLTCCAERNAIFAMANAGEREVECVTIFTPTTTVTAPCGACRQVIREFGPKATVISTGLKKARKVWTMVELLPDSFGPEDLAG